jgi:hypothetical protein
MKVAKFIVKGPFAVDAPLLASGRHISGKEAKVFWDQHSTLATERGCYIFAFRAAKGIVPIYVGKAAKSFAQEVFADHKLNKYNQGLASRKKGTPILFFVCLKKSKGPVNRKAIGEVESHLIQLGLAANRKLLNNSKTKVEAWSIAGVVRSGVGKPSKSAIELCRCLKL